MKKNPPNFADHKLMQSDRIPGHGDYSGLFSTTTGVFQALQNITPDLITQMRDAGRKELSISLPSLTAHQTDSVSAASVFALQMVTTKEEDAKIHDYINKSPNAIDPHSWNGLFPSGVEKESGQDINALAVPIDIADVVADVAKSGRIINALATLIEIALPDTWQNYSAEEKTTFVSRVGQSPELEATYIEQDSHTKLLGIRPQNMLPYDITTLNTLHQFHFEADIPSDKLRQESLVSNDIGKGDYKQGHGMKLVIDRNLLQTLQKAESISKSIIRDGVH